MRHKPSCYLAGPISGLTYGESKSWRNIARDLLAPDIDAFCPMRGQEHLAAHGVLEGSYDNNVLTTARAIMVRDHWDCKHSDLIIANFLGATLISRGTMFEIAWAHAYNKPLIVVMEPSGNPNDYVMVSEATTYRVTDLEHAVSIARGVLLP